MCCGGLFKFALKLLLDIQVLYSFWCGFGFLVEEACEHIAEVYNLNHCKGLDQSTDWVVL